jgi:hypothetical protein
MLLMQMVKYQSQQLEQAAGAGIHSTPGINAEMTA